MTISKHQKTVIERMQAGEPLYKCFIQIKTIIILEKKGLIEKVDGKYKLTEDGETMKF